MYTLRHPTVNADCPRGRLETDRPVRPLVRSECPSRDRRRPRCSVLRSRKAPWFTPCASRPATCRQSRPRGGARPRRRPAIFRAQAVEVAMSPPRLWGRLVWPARALPGIAKRSRSGDRNRSPRTWCWPNRRWPPTTSSPASRPAKRCWSATRKTGLRSSCSIVSRRRSMSVRRRQRSSAAFARRCQRRTRTLRRTATTMPSTS